jgi:hypothetical protein
MPTEPQDLHDDRSNLDRVSGWSLVAGTALSVFAMAHHPSAAASGTAERLAEMARMATLSAVVHGTLIALMLLIVFGLVGLAGALGFGLARVRAGMVAYSAGVVCMLGAALVSGFIVPALAGSYAGSTENMDLLAPVFSLCFRANQALAEVGVVAQSVGIFLWSLVLLGRSEGVRWVGWLGFVAGALPVLGLLAGRLHLDVHGMLAVVVLQAMWTIAAGVWLIRRGRSSPRAD